MPGAKAEGAQTGLACRGCCAPTEANAQPCVPARCLGCGNEPGPVGVRCPTTSSGTVASVATLTLEAPTLSLELVLGPLLAHPWVSG